MEIKILNDYSLTIDNKLYSYSFNGGLMLDDGDYSFVIEKDNKIYNEVFRYIRKEKLEKLKIYNG